MQAVKREAFGFTLPHLSLFGRRDKGGPAAGDDRDAELDHVTLAVVGASRGGDGRWIIRLEGDQVWRQTDSEQMSPPRPGARAEIRKAMLGSFFMSVDGRRSIRVERAH
jgi:hypothetical protein